MSEWKEDDDEIHITNDMWIAILKKRIRKQKLEQLDFDKNENISNTENDKKENTSRKN